MTSVLWEISQGKVKTKYTFLSQGRALHRLDSGDLASECCSLLRSDERQALAGECVDGVLVMTQISLSADQNDRDTYFAARRETEKQRKQKQTKYKLEYTSKRKLLIERKSIKSEKNKDKRQKTRKKRRVPGAWC